MNLQWTEIMPCLWNAKYGPYDLKIRGSVDWYIGDVEAREEIEGYPSFRIYVGSREVGKTLEGAKRTVEDFAKRLAEFTRSTNQLFAEYEKTRKENEK